MLVLYRQHEAGRRLHAADGGHHGPVAITKCCGHLDCDLVQACETRSKRGAINVTHDIPSVARDMSLEEYVHEVLRTGVMTHLVTGAGTPVGLISLQAARKVPRDEWANTSVQAVMLPVDRIEWAAPEEPVLAVLERMQKEDISQMPVISDGHIVGVVARDTILRVLQTRLQMGHLAHQ